jgi:glycosyltransferase involved in cell wall biosynthesis
LLRVLHAISGINPENGGPPIALAGLAAAQVRASLDVSIVSTWTTDPCPHVVADLQAEGIAVTHIGPAKNPMSRHPDLPRVLDDLLARADVLHVHAMWEQIQHVACRVARRRAVPYVYTPHGMLDPWNMSNGAIKKRLYLALRMRKNLDRAAALHFTTEIERAAVARMRLRPPAIVEPLGIVTKEFENLPPPGTFRDRHPALAGKRLITFLGRLDRGKGLELLIPAFAQTAGTFPDAHLVIVGPDSHSGYRATVESLVRQHNLTNRVLLTGMLKGPDKLAALVDTYVLCQPSFHENFGVVVVEALACGTPVIVSDQVYLHPEVTGAGVGTVTRTTVESVASELSRWLTDPAVRANSASKARPCALSTFDWDHIAHNWVEHYRVAANAQPRAASGAAKPLS